MTNNRTTRAKRALEKNVGARAHFKRRSDRNTLGNADRWFWPKVDRGGPDDCWRWKGSLRPNKSGNCYGGTSLFGKQILAHRVAYMLSHGAVESGLVIDHVCGVTSCVNPAHLRAVTQRENVLAGRSKAARIHNSDSCERGHLKSIAGREVYPGRWICHACNTDREGYRRWKREALESRERIAKLEAECEVLRQQRDYDYRNALDGFAGLNAEIEWLESVIAAGREMYERACAERDAEREACERWVQRAANRGRLLERAERRLQDLEDRTAKVK